MLGIVILFGICNLSNFQFNYCSAVAESREKNGLGTFFAAFLLSKKRAMLIQTQVYTVRACATPKEWWIEGVALYGIPWVKGLAGWPSSSGKGRYVHTH